MVSRDKPTAEQHQLAKVSLINQRPKRINLVCFLRHRKMPGSRVVRNYQGTLQLRTRATLRSRLKSQLRQSSLQAKLSIEIGTSPSLLFRSTQLLSSQRRPQKILVAMIIEIRALWKKCSTGMRASRSGKLTSNQNVSLMVPAKLSTLKQYINAWT